MREGSKLFGKAVAWLQSHGYEISDEEADTVRVRVTKDGCRAVLGPTKNGSPEFVEFPAFLLNGHPAQLEDNGFQKFLVAGGIRRAATADELHALQGFCAELKYALGLSELWNESLGSVNDSHNYDSLRRLS